MGFSVGVGVQLITGIEMHFPSDQRRGVEMMTPLALFDRYLS